MGLSVLCVDGVLTVLFYLGWPNNVKYIAGHSQSGRLLKMEEFQRLVCFRFILGPAIPKVYSTDHQFHKMLLKKKGICDQVCVGAAIYSIPLLDIYSEH